MSRTEHCLWGLAVGLPHIALMLGLAYLFLAPSSDPMMPAFQFITEEGCREDLGIGQREVGHG